MSKIVDIDIDIDKVSEIIKFVSETEILPLFQNLKTADIREKNPGDFVTIADEASERALTEKLTELLPDSLVVGEEAVAKDKTVLERLSKDKPVWIVDPIDGTFNYKNGNKHFGVLVSLVKNNETLYGWGYDVLEKTMYYASKGSGAFVEQNGQHKELKIEKSPELKNMTGHMSNGMKQGDMFDNVKSHVADLQNLRCALHDFIYFLTGKIDFIIHLHTTPWDHAAVILITEEAGGKVSLNDENYRPADAFGTSLLLVSSDEERHEELSDTLMPYLKEYKKD